MCTCGGRPLRSAFPQFKLQHNFALPRARPCDPHTRDERRGEARPEETSGVVRLGPFLSTLLCLYFYVGFLAPLSRPNYCTKDIIHYTPLLCSLSHTQQPNPGWAVGVACDININTLHNIFIHLLRPASARTSSGLRPNTRVTAH